MLGASFIGMAIWTLILNKIDEAETTKGSKYGVFGATLGMLIAAAIFAILGVLTLLQVDRLF